MGPAAVELWHDPANAATNTVNPASVVRENHDIRRTLHIRAAFRVAVFHTDCSGAAAFSVESWQKTSLDHTGFFSRPLTGCQVGDPVGAGVVDVLDIETEQVEQGTLGFSFNEC